MNAAQAPAASRSSTHGLQLHGDAVGVSADGRHPAAERLPDGAVPLQGALVPPVQTPQTPTEGRQRHPGGEHGLDLSSEEDHRR